MKVSLDGGRTYADITQGVRVIYEVNAPGAEEPARELRVHLDERSIHLDVWRRRDHPGAPDRNLGEHDESIIDIVDQLIGA